MEGKRPRISSCNSGWCIPWYVRNWCLHQAWCWQKLYYQLLRASLTADEMPDLVSWLSACHSATIAQVKEAKLVDFLRLKDKLHQNFQKFLNLTPTALVFQLTCFERGSICWEVCSIDHMPAGEDVGMGSIRFHFRPQVATFQISSDVRFNLRLECSCLANLLKFGLPLEYQDLVRVQTRTIQIPVNQLFGSTFFKSICHTVPILT